MVGASITNFLFPLAPAVFVSDYSLAESIERVRAALETSGSMFGSVMVGTVTETKVCLSREAPSVGNPYKPYFTGSFREGEQGVLLSGHFAMSKGAEAYVTFQLSIIVLLSGAMVLGSLWEFSQHWYVPGIAIGFAVLALLALKANQQLSGGDVACLARVIDRALTSPGKLSPPV